MDKVNCECGCSIQKRFLKKHLGTDKHKVLSNGGSLQDYHNMIGRRSLMTDISRQLEKETDERLRDAYDRSYQKNEALRTTEENRYLKSDSGEESV